MITRDDLSGKIFEGFYQINDKARKEIEALNATAKKKSLTPEMLDAIESNERKIKRYDYRMRINYVIPSKHGLIFLAIGEDAHGVSCTSGLVSLKFKPTEYPRIFRKLSDSIPEKKPHIDEAVVLMSKQYPALPDGFPTEFYGGFDCIPYTLPESDGLFDNVSYFGILRKSPEGLSIKGTYQVLNMDREHHGVFELNNVPGMPGERTGEGVLRKHVAP
jgi:hypothetical protein